MSTLYDKSTIETEEVNDDSTKMSSNDTKIKSVINVQSLYNKIESIKSTMSMANADRPELWIQRQNLQDLYHQVILNDIEFTIDKKLEQDLWNLVFKNHISYFQSQIKEHSVPLSTTVQSKNKNLIGQTKKLEAQSNLSFFLEAARGFYTKLLDDLIKKYSTSVNVSFYQRFPSLFDQMNAEFDQIEPTREKQVLYICQHTLTHLGDIARYSIQFEEAKNYYLHAIKLVPYLGHPYNQLGILFETSKTNQLSTVFYYIRSISTRYTFPLASTNLENFFHKIIDTQVSRYNSSQLSQKDLLTLFLQLNAILHSLQTGKNSKSLNSNPVKLKNFFDVFKTSFQNFIQSQLFDKLDWSQFSQIVSIIIFQITQQPSALIQNDLKMKENFDAANKVSLDLFVFIVHQFVALFNKNITSDQVVDLVLPSLYLSFNFMETFKNGFLVKENVIFQDESFDSIVNFLNGLNMTCEDTSDYPLVEDRMLDGFLPFKDVHKNFVFKKYMSNNKLLEESEEKKLRKIRIIAVFERLISNCPGCYLKVEVPGVKFGPSESYPFKPQLEKVEPQIERPQQQPVRRRRQNIALSSMTGEIDKKSDHLLLTRPTPVPQPRFPCFTGPMPGLPQNQRFAQPQQWQTPNFPNYGQNETFFPSASSRQFPIQMPNRNIPHQTGLNNGFPSFLPNEKSSDMNQGKFNQMKPSQQQFAPPGFQNQSNDYLSNLLIQQLMNNTRNEPKNNNTFENNMNMINYMQMQEDSIWSYREGNDQNFKK